MQCLAFRYCNINLFLGKLIELLEVLASHSISSVELKMFLRLLTPNKEGQLPTHSLVLQKTLLNMTMKDTRNLPLNTIDLTAMESVSYESVTSCDLIGSYKAICYHGYYCLKTLILYTCALVGFIRLLLIHRGIIHYSGTVFISVSKKNWTIMWRHS